MFDITIFKLLLNKVTQQQGAVLRLNELILLLI